LEFLSTPRRKVIERLHLLAVVGFLWPELLVAPAAPEVAVLELGYLEEPLATAAEEVVVELLPVVVLLPFIINIIIQIS
jgi:hypothetical protein